MPEIMRSVFLQTLLFFPMIPTTLRITGRFRLPGVPIDTNHLERALRAIPMGRKNWNFCWTELGAQHVGIVQSLIVTCRLHRIDPYQYLIDVLQRVAQHPASCVAQLTPRLWKSLFASTPLRSDLHTLAA